MHGHISWTQISMLSQCGERYRRRYVEGQILPPGIAFVRGKSVDKQANRNLQHKIDTGELLSIEECMAIARDAVNAEWDSPLGVMLTDEEKSDGADKTRGKVVDSAVRLSALHSSAFAPKLDPLYVQREWLIEMPGYPVKIKGVMDLQERVSAGYGPPVRDLKTSKRTPPKGSADKSDQLTVYAMAGLVLDGKPPKYIALDTLVDVAQPKIDVQVSTRDRQDFHIILARLENAIQCIEKGAFVPARRDDWWCNPKWCGFFDTCPYVRGRKQFSLGAK